MKTVVSFLLIWLLSLSTYAATTNYVFSTSESQVAENVSTHQICFTVKLTPAPKAQDAPSVEYSFANGTAEGATSYVNDGHHDFNNQSGTVQFTDGTYTTYGTGQSTYATKPVCTAVYDDTVYEGLSENFYFQLSSPSPHASAGDTAVIATGSSSVTGTITENETPTKPTFRIGDASGPESSGTFTFDVNLSAPLNTAVTIQYTTKNITARSELSNPSAPDYNATSGTLTFAPNETSKTISVHVINDTIVETLNETFEVLLSNWSSNVEPYDVSGIGTITDDDGQTSQYCSPYRGMITINEYHHMTTYKDIGTDHPIQYGNFIELKRDPAHINPDFQPGNDWTIVVYTGTGGAGKSFTFAERDESCGINSPYLIFDYENWNLPGTSVDVGVYDGTGKEVDFFSLNNPGYKVSECKAHPDALGQSFYYDTDYSIGNAADKDMFRNPDGTGDWTSAGSGANSGATRCWEPISLQFGVLDALDNDLAPTFSPYSSILKTKITNKSKDLKIISLNSTKTGYQTLSDVTVKVFRVDSDGSISEAIGDVAFNNGSFTATPLINFSRPFAKKDSRILFQYCDVNGSVYGHYDQCIANNGTIKSSVSFDNFAIRPNLFDSNITSSGTWKGYENKYIEILAKAYDGVATPNYNEAEGSSSSFKVDVNVSDVTKACAEPILYFQPSVNFSDGNATTNRHLRNVGDLNVTIHENAGLEYAHVDVDDTPDSDRYITPYNATIKVIPDHFSMDTITFKNGSNGFSYLSNFESYPNNADRNVSGYVDLNITARGVTPGNNVLSNYTSTCYAKSGNIKMNLPSALSSGTLTKLLWYDQKHDFNGSSPLGGSSYMMDMNASQFNSADTNGSAQVRYLINFDRNQTQLISPFTLAPTSFDVNDTDGVYGTQNSSGSAYYVYGRIYPRDMRIFGANAFVANGWYEVFGTTTIGTTTLSTSKNDAQWSTNILHNDVNDGDSRVTRLVSSGGASTVNYGGNTVNGVEAFTFTTAISPTYNGKAHIDTAPWLWYAPNALTYSDPSTFNPANATDNEAACLTHPCFNVTVMPAIGATGSAKQDLSGDKSSKTSGSTGTWKSHSDYAPAIK